MEKRTIGNKSTHLSHLGHQVKELLITISTNLSIDSHLINMATETTPSFEIFCIPNVTLTLLNKFTSKESEKTHFKYS